MAYQSLYRQYRPQRFAEIKGQDHVVGALQSAVRDDKVGHAYLLHGPRGSGKTSTARVLAKALNCENLDPGGEPCCECESCRSISEGRSFDLQELDAASNNKVDDMRALLERVNLATPGRAKVYLLDEVHMLTPGAENALLKTLEEPPGHVTWVLATTEPHKVAQTIRSRCQVFELGLVAADLMAAHVRHVISDAGLELDDAAVNHVVAASGGSVRDALSELDRVAAGGLTVKLDSTTDSILDAIAGRDPAGALSAIGEATGRGRDPRTIGEAVLAGLRDAFLAAMGDPPPRASEHDRDRAAGLAERMAPAALTRALETLGRALIDMRQAPDPRIDIEVALVHLCQLDGERSLEALLQRVRRLEERLGSTHGDATSGGAARGGAGPRDVTGSGADRGVDPGARDETASASRDPVQPRRRDPGASPASDASPRRQPGAAGPAQSARETLRRRAGPPTARAFSPAQPAAAAPPQAAPPPPPVLGQDPAALRPQTAKEVVELAERHLGLSREFVVARANEILPPRESGPRRPDELLELWRDLIAGSSARPPAHEELLPESPESGARAADHGSGPGMGQGSVSSPVPVPEPERADAPEPQDAEPVRQAVPGAGAAAVRAGDSEPDDEQVIDLDDLADAPSEAVGIEAKLMQAFPGSEIVTLHESEQATTQ